ncbi:MAG: hypothetical protein CML17_10885 [Pusillimonas sp.]|jgi:hypothetical protein|nr:hypothetical protein [Pusillimonas sp.]
MARFWTQNIELKRSYKWIARISLFDKSFFGDGVDALDEDSDISIDTGNDPVPFIVQSFTKPEFGFQTLEIKDSYGPHRRLIAGSAKWGSLEINLYDVVDSNLNVSKQLYDWLSSVGYKSGQENPSQDWVDASRAIRKLSKGDLIFLTLEHIDSNGKKIEEWQFNQPVIKAISFGDALSYESDSPVIVKLGVEIASAKYTYLDNN